ncbi:enterobactin exporter EntS [Aquisphaera giovannonii]|uniref:Enterobactin exporter EntS n=1 Tax=Aquisphaera giovannonii TaxID=406548 RepID=A0A5B9VVN3_9BACT|nr:MFS transporter [Aquisphaera giovannonii]QEH32302.1 enterobactin exporter EntS [Aquisphaera giovannonii]
MAAGLSGEGAFLRFWSAQAISAVGSRITTTALPILAVMTIGATEEAVATLSAIAMAPGVLVGLTMGGHVDRRRKRPLLIGSDLVRAGLLLTVPAAAWLGVLGMGQLYVVAAINGAAYSLFAIADNAYLPTLIGRELLVEGNSKLETTEAIAEISGPALGGILVQAITAPLAIVLDAVSFLASAVLLASIRRDEVPAAGVEDRPTALGDLRFGLRAVLGNPLVRPEFLAEAVASLSSGAFVGLYTIYAIRTLGLSPAGLGAVIGCGGVGALFGAMLAGRLARRLGFGPAMVACLAIGRAAGLLIPLARGPEWLAYSCLVGHQLVGDGFLVASSILAVSLRQSVLRQEALGRANAVFHVSSGLLLPLGAVVAGLIAAASDARTALWIGTLGGLLTPLIVGLSAVAGLRAIPIQPAAHVPRTITAGAEEPA